MIKATVLEDDGAAREYIISLLKHMECDFEIKSLGSIDELDTDNPSDLYLLDIELAEGNSGIKAAEFLRASFGDEPCIIFITAHDGYMLNAFDAGAFNYILKPIDTERFFKVINEAAERINGRKTASKPTLTVKCRGEVHALNPNELCYAESANHKVVFYTKESSFECYGRLRDWEEKLGEGFFRVHRGYLVNLSQVAGYTNEELRLKNGSVIYIARHKLKAFKAAHLDYLRKKL